MANEASEVGSPSNPSQIEQAPQSTGGESGRSAEKAIREKAFAAQKKMAAKFNHIVPASEASESLFLRDDSPVADAQVVPFEKFRAAYEKKKRAQTSTIHDEVEFMKLEAAESARLRKEKADELYDQQVAEEDDASETEVNVPDLPELSSDDESEATPKPKRKSKPKVRDGHDDDEEPEPEPKKRRGTNVKKPKSTARGNQNKKPVKKGKVKEGPNLINVASLRVANVFGDAEKVAGLENQPSFAAGTKLNRRDLALRGLMASVPEQSRPIASVDKNYLNEAIKAFTGKTSVKPTPEGWLVSGMRSPLKHYQILGTAWMRRRENSSSEPKGGIQADQMGLGKTLMMLANIINGPAMGQGKKVKRATLIVATPALVTQWYDEIHKHCFFDKENKQHGLKSVVKHISSSRITATNAVEILEQSDIVLTSYQEVMRSYPKMEFPPSLVTASQKDDYWKKHYMAERGTLHSARFYRVVLDEAQAIKNHQSHTSRACRALEAKFRWAISGTPIMNTTKEFYPYFKFLKVPETGSFKIFKENFGSSTLEDPQANNRLHAFLRRIMIRRTHEDTLFNARLLDLPPPKEHTHWLEFNDVERAIYEIVKKRFIERINKISKDDGLERQYKHIWTMILRLRQLTAHPLLVQGTIFDLLQREDFERLNKLTEPERLYSEEGANLLLHLRSVLKNNSGVNGFAGGATATGTFTSEDETVPIDLLDVEGDISQTGGAHGLSFRFRKYLETLVQSDRWGEISARSLCTGCRQPPMDPQVTSCFHIYCKTCVNDIKHAAARRGFDQARCSECGETFNDAQPCEGLEEFASWGSHASSEDGPRSSKAKGAKKPKPSAETDWIGMEGEVCPSAKTSAVKAQVMNWLEEDPTGKIIIYTQFLPMIRILAKVCQTEGWGCCKYTGEMSHDSREKSLAEFASKKANKIILLASLKSGGIGLNLTMASRVICIDPWWNEAVEQQAFCRVYRIGQEKETRMTKFAIKNTIDSAMTRMKERKSAAINDAMKNSKSFTTKELLELFGDVAEDDEGKPFIIAEYDGEEDHFRVPNDSDDEHLGNDP